jgi:NAD(P)-dependent dehydrogenase (short-subunit alcohol dehydrogenase family)
MSAMTRRSVLVTGASKGIGEACALRLAERGWRVFAGVRRAQDGASLQQRAVTPEARGAIVPVLLDVTDVTQLEDAAALVAAETGGRLHALVNNAGIAVAGPLEFLPIDEFRRQLEINVVGQLAVTQAMLPLLRAARQAADDHRAGRIIFMSSVSGRSAVPFVGAYGASKFALEATADALRVELLPYGIRVVLVEPGVIATPIWDTSVERVRENVGRMPPEAHEYYGRTLRGVEKWTTSAMKGLPPQRVAGVVLRALTARRPRARYIVGADARARIALEAVMPTRLRDWLMDQVVRRL